MNNFATEIKVLAGIVILGFIGMLAIISITYVPVGEQAMVKNRLNGETYLIKDNGITLTKPLVESAQMVSVAENTYSYDDQANTNDNIQVTYNTSVTYKIIDANLYYNKRFTFETDNIIQLMNSELTKSLDRVSNKYTYDHVKSNVAAVGDEITADSNKTLSTYGIEIVSVSVKGFAAPETVEAAIQDKVSKQQQMEASVYEVEKAENEAKAQKVKQQAVSQEQQQMELCNNAIANKQGNSPACYFGEGNLTIAGSTSVAV